MEVLFISDVHIFLRFWGFVDASRQAGKQASSSSSRSRQAGNSRQQQATAGNSRQEKLRVGLCLRMLHEILWGTIPPQNHPHPATMSRQGQASRQQKAQTNPLSHGCAFIGVVSCGAVRPAGQKALPHPLGWLPVTRGCSAR